MIRYTLYRYRFPFIRKKKIFILIFTIDANYKNQGYKVQSLKFGTYVTDGDNTCGCGVILTINNCMSK